MVPLGDQALGVCGPFPRPPPSSGPLLTTPAATPTPISQPRSRCFLHGSQYSPVWPDLFVYVCALISPARVCDPQLVGGRVTPGFWSWWPSGQGGPAGGSWRPQARCRCPALAPGPRVCQSCLQVPAFPLLLPSGGDWRRFLECELWGPRGSGEICSPPPPLRHPSMEHPLRNLCSAPQESPFGSLPRRPQAGHPTWVGLPHRHPHCRGLERFIGDPHITRKGMSNTCLHTSGEETFPPFLPRNLHGWTVAQKILSDNLALVALRAQGRPPPRAGPRSA